MAKKLLRFGSYVLVAALASALTLAMAGGPVSPKLDLLQALIEERYVGEVDVRKLEDAAANAMIAATGDRWSYYISAEEYDSYVEQEDNAYVGIGITVEEQEGAGFLVVEVKEGSPAQEAGLQFDDLIVQVGEQDVRSLNMTEFGNLVRGEEGTKITLTVLRQEERQTVSVERRRIEEIVAQGTLLENGVGLIRISNFDSRCASESIAAIEMLRAQGAEKLIFDVRNNPGGFAEELVELLDYLLPEGDLFRSVSYDGKESVDVSDAACLELPMAVLVNGNSYSAAEFFAAALQEYGAAVVVGEPTVGKGRYQNTFRLGDGSAVALSTGKYYTPKGNNLEGVGIIPDIPVEVDAQTMWDIYYEVLSPEKDPQIQAAVEALS